MVALIKPSDLMHAATMRKRPFDDRDWIYELKYDGFRCLAQKAGDAVALVSREGNLFNASFPDVVAAVAALPGDFACDAELTVDDASGRSSFERLQKRAVTKKPGNVRAAAASDPARLYLFDALVIDGIDLRELPLETRKAHLRDLFEDTRTLIYASGVPMAGTWAFSQAQALDLEGIMAKRCGSPYRRGRSFDWVKIKNQQYSRKAALGWGRKNPA
jgi:bifunctional non-homologous end joining protein LigD